MILPIIQKKYPFVMILPLKGAVTYAENAKFSFKDWFSGEYQSKKEKYINDAFGFRPLFIRWHNQIEYSLFNKFNARDIVEGKDKYMFEGSYIRSYYGQNFIGQSALDKVARNLEFLSNKLSLKGKKLLVVFAPGKPAVYPEYIPEELRQPTRKITNLDCFASLLSQRGVSFVDFNRWFVSLRKEVEFPLITPYNLHWTPFGALLCADSLNRKIEQICKRKMPSISYKCQVSDTFADNEKDILVNVNLVFPFPENMKTCHPEVTYSDSGCRKMNAVIFADSFFWTLLELNYPQKVFNDFEFWYYGNHVWGNNGLDEDYKKMNLNKSIEKADIVIFLAAQKHPTWFDWCVADLLKSLE